jgi:NADH:ubiquinone oxidoreductase subunit 5 (subunit L)/multisubunit Na+/H+ antiporter MnhA subunit
MQSLIAGVVGLPLLASVLIVTILRRPPTARCAALAAVALTALCAAALAFYAPDASLVITEWLPSAGPMGLTAGASGLYAALATTLGLLLVLLYVPAPPLASAVKKPIASTTHIQASEASSKEKAREGLFPVLLLALTGANAALLADHFLLRYVALEVAALCILLIPLAEKPIPAADPSARGGYLLLRLGDAGLLAAILILWRAAGTLRIDPALDAGKALGSIPLGWAAAGLALAVWVKLGGWPFHTWSQTGRRLSLASQAWLYATVVPNLGLYLLYRITPLLAYAGPVRATALWIGAIGALLAALLALAQPEPRAALVHVGAAQGGLMLVVAAAGVKSAVWLGLLALTPLRLLLFLAADAAQKAKSTMPRRVATGLLVFGGLALLAFNLVTMWWTQENVPPIALFIAQVTAALVGVWAVKPCEGSARARGPEELSSAQVDSSTKATTNLRKVQWAALILLSAIVLIGGLAFGPLVRFTADVTHTTTPATPTLQTLTTSLPALLAAGVLTVALWQLRRRPILAAILQKTDRDMWDSEKGLARIAGTLRTVIEVTILERTVAWIKHAVTDSARIVWIVEHGVLEGTLTWTKRAVTDGAKIVWIVEHGVLEGVIDRSVQAVIDGAGIAYSTIEQEGLEGILRRAVSAALALGRRMQRWHTGRLRRNLLWVPVALALAILTLIIAGGKL